MIYICIIIYPYALCFYSIQVFSCALMISCQEIWTCTCSSLCLANNINVEEVRPVALHLECFGVLGGKEVQSEPSAVQHRHQCL